MKVKKVIIKVYQYLISVYNTLIKISKTPPIVNNIDDTIDKIIIDKCSVSRYGDGELGLIYGKDIGFQNYSEDLSLKLKNIIKSKSKNHIVCLPNVFDSLDHFNNSARIFWKEYVRYRRNSIYKIIDMKKIYYDAHITRLYMDFDEKDKVEKRFNRIKQIWNNREVIIVEGETSRLGVGNDLFSNTRQIERIICPSKNSFEEYNRIIQEIKKHEKSKLILIALGPTATVLAYDLSKDGYQAIDIGHIDIEYEWFLMGAKSKCEIKNKYVNEVNSNIEIGELTEEKYISEIVSKIL